MMHGRQWADRQSRLFKSDLIGNELLDIQMDVVTIRSIGFGLRIDCFS
mgnify:CR=1 FL=1